MEHLSSIDKQVICRFFGITDGIVFKFLKDIGKHNKTKTKELILESCGINIFNDQDYKTLSQQKCIEKIWNTCSPQIIASMLKTFCNYMKITIEDKNWNETSFQRDYSTIENIIKRLESTYSIELPIIPENKKLQIFFNEIQSSIKNENPEMALDRLHTFSTDFFRYLCKKHGISTENDRGNEYPLQSLVGRLKNWYEKNHYFDSEFSIVAIQNTINIFDKFNTIRNNQSAAHPNEMLNKVEAMYVVRIVAETLTFIDNIEHTKIITIGTVMVENKFF